MERNRSPLRGVPARGETIWLTRTKKSNDGGDKGKDKDKQKLTTKEYEKELAKLHVELVKLQEWVKAKGLKVCIVFEGPRRRRQGRHDQGDHRAREPARVSRRSRCRRRPSARRARCTSSATCRTCRRPARS